MDARRQKLGPLEIIAVIVLVCTLLVALAIAAPSILPGSDTAELIFRVTWSVMMVSGGIMGRALILAAALSVAVLVRVAMRRR